MQNRTADEHPRERDDSDRRGELPTLYQVLIECRDEKQQREIYEQLRSQRLKVRLLVL